MAKAKYGYGWLIKWIIAALLVGVGIYMAFSPEAVYMVTGIAIVIFSLFRVYPLLKTLNKEILRTINLIEIIAGTVLGVIMIYAVLSQDELSESWLSLYGWFLALFFYARGVIFFVSTSFFDEKTEVPKFIFHISALTVGTAIAVLTITNEFDVRTVGFLFLIVAILGAVYLGYDGYGGYQKYRQFSKSLNTKKTKEAEVKYEKDLPKEDIEKEKGTPEPHIDEEE